MQIDVSDHPVEGAFRKGVIKSVRVDGDRMIEDPQQMMDAVNNVREDFPRSLIVFPRDQIAWDFQNNPGFVQSGQAQLGWHYHREFDTVNISQGSSIPTEIALNLQITAFALFRAIDQFLPGAMAVSQMGVNHVVPLCWVSEHEIHKLAMPMLQHMLLIREKLMGILGGEIATQKEVQAVMDHFRYLAAMLGPAGEMMLVAAQQNIPASHKFSLSPSEFGAYVIPELGIHARSAIGGELERPQEQQNGCLCINRETGEEYKFLGLG